MNGKPRLADGAGPLLLFVLSAMLAGCQREQVVVVDTSPIGSGLAVIGIGLVLAAWISSIFGGGQ